MRYLESPHPVFLQKCFAGDVRFQMPQGALASDEHESIINDRFVTTVGAHITAKSLAGSVFICE